MPGVKSINWTENNRAKAFDALLFYTRVTVTNEIADEIAKHVGVGCSGKAVKSLLANQKHKFQVSNGTLATKHANAKSATSTPTKAMGSDKVISGRVGKSSAAKTKKSAKAKVKHEDSEDEDMGRLVTPPESAEEAMEVKRSSPRTPKKIIDYLAFGNGSDDDQTLHAASGDDSGSEFDVKTHIKADVDAE